MRQGGVLKHIVSTSLLTLKDTFEAREIYNHSIDVWAYIKTLQPPRYPFAINKNLAEKLFKFATDVLEALKRPHDPIEVFGVTHIVLSRYIHF